MSGMQERSPEASGDPQTGSEGREKMTSRGMYPRIEPIKNPHTYRQGCQGVLDRLNLRIDSRPDPDPTGKRGTLEQARKFWLAKIAELDQLIADRAKEQA